MQKKVYSYISGDWQLMTGDLFIYDIQGNLILEADQSGEIQKEYLYLEGSRIAQYGYDDLQMAQAVRPWIVKHARKTQPQPLVLRDKNPLQKKAIRVATVGTLAGLLLQVNPGDIYAEVLYYYINDHLGTPQLMTDHEGQVVWRADYDPFGEASVDPGASAVNQHRFPGQYQDEETQLNYNYHRYYDPRSGRYVTADPIGLESGINLFLYVANCPLNWIDPLGKRAKRGPKQPTPFSPGKTGLPWDDLLDEMSGYLGKLGAISCLSEAGTQMANAAKSVECGKVFTFWLCFDAETFPCQSSSISVTVDTWQPYVDKKKCIRGSMQGIKPPCCTNDPRPPVPNNPPPINNPQPTPLPFDDYSSGVPSDTYPRLY